MITVCGATMFPAGTLCSHRKAAPLTCGGPCRVQEDRQAHAEEAASAFQQLKAQLPNLFRKCNHLAACLPYMTRLADLTIGVDEAHLYAPEGFDIVTSLDSRDHLTADAESALTGSQADADAAAQDQGATSVTAGRPGSVGFVRWAQRVYHHKASFKAECQLTWQNSFGCRTSSACSCPLLHTPTKQ